jgi:hypothetical protein
MVVVLLCDGTNGYGTSRDLDNSGQKIDRQKPPSLFQRSVQRLTVLPSLPAGGLSDKSARRDINFLAAIIKTTALAIAM